MYNGEPPNLFYSMHDGTSLDTRLEWWKGDMLTGYAAQNATAPPAASLSFHVATFVWDVKPTANLTVRPTFQRDWPPTAGYDQTYVDVDDTVTF